MKTVMCYTAGQTTKGAVAIRKPAGTGNGYRVCWMGAFRKYESPVPPLCGDTGPEKRLKVFSGFEISYFQTLFGVLGTPNIQLYYGKRLYSYIQSCLFLCHHHKF